MSGANALNGNMPSVDANGNFLDPNAMQGMMNNGGMMNGQNYMVDPSMGGMNGFMPMGNEQLMLPLMQQPNGHSQAPQPPRNLNADEIALYDRQIRLWGVAAQAKIQSASILLITLKSLSSEIAKNLVLAGISSLTILDDAPVSEADLGAGFFLSEAAAEAGDPSAIIGKNRAETALPFIQKLNPRVQVKVDTEGVTQKGSSYFGSFDVVIATDLQPDSLSLINTATRVFKKPFYAAGTYGLYGFIFSDLIEHDFVITRDQGNVPTKPKPETRTRSIIDVQTHKEASKTIESVTKKELYSTWLLASDGASLPEDLLKSRRRLRALSPALSCLQALWTFSSVSANKFPSTRDDLKEFTRLATIKHKALSLPAETLTPEFLRSFLQNMGSEIAPVSAILGGQLAQDVINVLGGKEQPIQNMVIFDGERMEASVLALHPSGLLGRAQLEGGGMMGGQDMSMGGMGGMGGMGFDPSAMGGYQGGMDMSGMNNMAGFPQGMAGLNGQMDANFQAPPPPQPQQQNAPPQAQLAQNPVSAQQAQEHAAGGSAEPVQQAPPPEQPKPEEKAQAETQPEPPKEPEGAAQ